ncbi:MULTISPECIES: Bcr/CflA family efflux MFS transporter [Wolbachia]|uniref:Bcr/CflA family efflux MFS transporter n=2 Tax=Wolbachieae TaxID=952 RepID=UPI001BAC43D0|nr:MULTISPECIES: Bcr/CflA family efflux MFS transporter [unclassified Wolbachia]QUI60944.1 Bcr/CflA family efflux MFS transporter [Wolbachia endosymbiont of Spodoptera picta]URG40551.1 Bcr/CflA family efflux MFS transporter [Wolbachia endosymbiont of Ostrinia furnacalis]URG41581.1 Bcr/CflA family efflux MFS transporter [Wolbachia endosymbiont of Ostrinia scapulalis]
MILSVAVVDMATDLYSVALPSIANYFKVKGNIAQLTISLNLVGVAISGLIYGPLSDYYGRRLIMLIGMTIFTLASIVCCIADNIILLILIRFIQGAGAGVAGVVGYAAIRDMYSGSEYSRVISKLNMIVALSPGIAPVVGSYIISHGYSWKFLFFIISLAAIIMLIFIYLKLQETLTVNKSKASINIFKQYILIFKNYRFLGFSNIHGLTFMWLWAYIANYPFIFESMGVEVQYFGYLISIIVIFYIIGTLINRRYVPKIGVSKMLIIGLVLPMISDGLLVYFYLANKLSVLILQVLWIPSNIGLALVISNNVTSALETIKGIGLGSAVLSFCNMMFGAIGIYIVGKFFHYSILPNLLLTVACSIIAILIYSLLKYTEKHREG